MEQNKEAITEMWFKAIVDSYPVESGKYLFSNKNKFTNPISYTYSTELPVIIDKIISGDFTQELKNSLENIIKIRAVQDYSASKALEFILYLKDIIIDYLKNNEADKFNSQQIYTFFRKLDDVFLICFDIYSELKEKLFEIKSNEIKSRFGNIVDRLNRKYDSSENN